MCNLLHDPATMNPSSNILLQETPFNLKAIGGGILRAHPRWLDKSQSPLS